MEHPEFVDEDTDNGVAPKRSWIHPPKLRIGRTNAHAYGTPATNAICYLQTYGPPL